MKKYNVFISILVIYFIVNMILFPKIYIDATFRGVSAWALSVLPSVLPFMFFTKVLSACGSTTAFSKVFSYPCKKLWNCPSASSFVFFTSIISGYPVGAAMTADLYQCGKISKTEAFRMCSFCSTSGPMFILGAVGVSMLGSAKFGYIILIAHILGAAFNGLLYRNIHATSQDKPQNIVHASNVSLSSIIQESVLSILSVGAIIAIFFVVITAFSPIFNLFPPQISCLLEGMVEITKGCSSIASHLSGLWAVLAATFIISFGGISTILQSITMLAKIKMPIKLFVLQRFTHALLSSVFAFLLFILL
ncbi:MAG: hypothetical protein J6A28_02410 [Clostridia bacterium]|nr:hypothetical protein [Clostridia bacterium]